MSFRRGGDALLEVSLTDDPDAPRLRQTEEQIIERYPWTYDKLTLELKRRFVDFKVNKDYHAIRRSLTGDERFMLTRYLDPGNHNSGKKIFFNPNILNEFSKHYARK